MEKTTASKKNRKLSTTDIVYVAMAVALISICSWIQIPASVPFTLQTFAVFLTICLLGGSRSCLTVIVYIALAAVGAPVLASFRGGIAALLGPTGGYVSGFLFIALINWLLEPLSKKALWIRALSLLIGLAVCYAFGTMWFMHIYTTGEGNHIGLPKALALCVTPFILPDLIKMVLAITIGNNKGIRKVIKPAG